MLVRAPTKRPLTPKELTLCTLIGANYTLAAIADEMHLNKDQIKYVLREAAKKLPGDLPRYARCSAWARGATVEVLEGTALKALLVETAARLRRSHNGNMLRQRLTTAEDSHAR